MEQEDLSNFEENEVNGLYADSFRIGHNAYKFVLDFGQCDSKTKSSRFHTRVIMGPDNAKGFLESLGQSIRQYEDNFGQINKDG